MIPAYGYAIAAMTVMLWILWSDSLRAHRPTPVLYGFRILVFLAASGIVVWNMFQYPWQYNATTRALVVVTALVGIAGAAHFARRLVRRT